MELRNPTVHNSNSSPEARISYSAFAFHKVTGQRMKTLYNIMFEWFLKDLSENGHSDGQTRSGALFATLIYKSRNWKQDCLFTNYYTLITKKIKGIYRKREGGRYYSPD